MTTVIETEQKTFGKATQKLVAKLIPEARTFKKIREGYKTYYLIKNSNAETVATWFPPAGLSKNGTVRLR